MSKIECRCEIDIRDLHQFSDKLRLESAVSTQCIMTMRYHEIIFINVLFDNLHSEIRLKISNNISLDAPVVYYSVDALALTTFLTSIKPHNDQHILLEFQNSNNTHDIFCFFDGICVSYSAPILQIDDTSDNSLHRGFATAELTSPDDCKFDNSLDFIKSVCQLATDNDYPDINFKFSHCLYMAQVNKADTSLTLSWNTENNLNTTSTLEFITTCACLQHILSDKLVKSAIINQNAIYFLSELSSNNLSRTPIYTSQTILSNKHN